MNAQEFPGRELALHRGADQIERARLGRDDVATAEFAEPQGPESARIDDRVQRAADRHDQRVGAFHALERIEQLILDLARFGAGDQVNQHFAVG